MIRGRHRGLPVAIDRAIVLPYEFERAEDDPDPPPRVDERRSSRYSAGAAPHPVGGSLDDIKHGHTVMEGERVGRDDVGDKHGSRTGDEEMEGKTG